MRPDVARATLRALAALQGAREDADTAEQPGKIVHEWWPVAPPRVHRLGMPVRDGGLRYYGSADGTAWFLVVLAALGERKLAVELDRAWRAAGDWLLGALRDGGGFVRHGHRAGERPGLAQQGWRDSTDPGAPGGHGIATPDGDPPLPPIADADSQAAAHAGLRALAALSGEPPGAREARALGARIEDAFGDGETIALDGGGRPVPGAGSQLGWLLWSGALAAAARTRVADRLCAEDVLTPFGLRTLSERHPAFAAHAYHRGSVWPFDSWLGWGGLRAAGREAAAERVRRGVLAALDRLGRYPELYAVPPGGGEPEATPESNRVQAWTVGARWALEQRWDGGAAALA